MERVCFRLAVRPDLLPEYVRRHRDVWPEMLLALQQTGWSNYSLFLDADGTLIGYFETDDLERALSGMAEREINSRWQAEMAPFFDGLAGTRPDEAFTRLDEIFHLVPPSVVHDGSRTDIEGRHE
ncbi:MAG: L-rhamnose mutarotase [Mycobacteriales bacterium]